MKKECIETLTTLTKIRINEVKEYKKVWSEDSSQIKLIDKNLAHLGECLNELNNLPKT